MTFREGRNRWGFGAVQKVQEIQKQRLGILDPFLQNESGFEYSVFEAFLNFLQF